MSDNTDSQDFLQCWGDSTPQERNDFPLNKMGRLGKLLSQKKVWDHFDEQKRRLDILDAQVDKKYISQVNYDQQTSPLENLITLTTLLTPTNPNNPHNLMTLINLVNLITRT